MGSILVKPENVPVKTMSARLKVMNSYPPQFLSPDNTPFLTGDMINIILGMMPKRWVDKMFTAKFEPMNVSIKELVDHLGNLENQDRLHSKKEGQEKE